MSTSVQHNNRLSWHVPNILQHGLEVQLAAVSLVIAVMLDVEPGVSADGVVVAPRGVGQVDVLVGVELGQVLGAHAEGAGAGDGLRVGVAAVGDHVAGVSEGKLGGLGPVSRRGRRSASTPCPGSWRRS